MLSLTDAVLREQLKEGEETREREEEDGRLSDHKTLTGVLHFTRSGRTEQEKILLLVRRGLGFTPGYTLHLHLIWELDL